MKKSFLSVVVLFMCAMCVQGWSPTFFTLNDIDSKDVVLKNVPILGNTYGDGPTAGGIVIGYYDRVSDYNLCKGNVPLTQEQQRNKWGCEDIEGHLYCPWIASKLGVGGRTTKGHVDDYWVKYDAFKDPYAGRWTEHDPDCIADFMGANMKRWKMKDWQSLMAFEGMNKFVPPMDEYEASQIGWMSEQFYNITTGMVRYIRYKGYDVSKYYTQRCKGYDPNNTELGFTFEEYKNEIDNGRPVLITHDMGYIVGMGYRNDGSQLLYAADTFGFIRKCDFAGDLYGYFGLSKMTGVCVIHVKGLEYISPNLPLIEYNEDDDDEYEYNDDEDQDFTYTTMTFKTMKLKINTKKQMGVLTGILQTTIPEDKIVLYNTIVINNSIELPLSWVYKTNKLKGMTYDTKNYILYNIKTKNINIKFKIYDIANITTNDVLIFELKSSMYPNNTCIAEYKFTNKKSK